MPASELAAARAEIAKLQRMLSKKTLKNEILKEAMEYAAKKLDCALALVARGREVKTVCQTMELSRSHMRDLLVRTEARTDGRRPRTPSGDAELRHEPSYGYRRACALVNRQRAVWGIQSQCQARLSRDGRRRPAVA